MIHKHEITDGLMLYVEPFDKSSRNAGCKIMAEIKSTRGTRRNVRFCVVNLSNLMPLSDAVILMNSLRALIDETNKLMGTVQDKAAKAVEASKPRRKSRKKSSG